MHAIQDYIVPLTSLILPYTTIDHYMKKPDYRQYIRFDKNCYGSSSELQNHHIAHLHPHCTPSPTLHTFIHIYPPYTLYLCLIPGMANYNSRMMWFQIFQQTGRLTYFEAIKCSPMKLRQSITTHKRPNVSSLIVSQQHFQKPVKERVPTSKYRSPVFEITQHPVRQLGSLCFQTKNSVRRPSEATYSSIRLVGGKISTSRRNAHYKTVARKGSELRVRCESVMIYPKTLIPPGNEKPSKKPTKPRKEAWRETSSVPAAVQSDEDCTKLPHLGVKKSETSEEKQNRKLSPELEGSSKAEQEQKQNSSNRSAAMKIVIPFGEDQEPHETVEGFGKLLRPATLKPEVLGRKSSQATSKVYYEQNSRKKGEHFYDNQKEYNPNSQEKSRRITSMVITQLGTPRKTLCNNPSFASETPNVPLSKIRTGTADTNGLFLGRENLLRQRAGARFSYNQRSRAADLGTQNKGRVLPERIDHEGGKCFLSTESGGSLTIGGTGLLKKQRRLHENFGKGEEIKDTGEQPGYFRNSLPHSHYIM